MRNIQKGAEPPSLTQHRQTPHADYRNYNDKALLRQHLVNEQSGICCYCMSRIRPTAERMKIEHWQCQEDHPHRQLDYANLQRELRKWRGDDGGELQPFNQVVVYYLCRRLKVAL